MLSMNLLASSFLLLWAAINYEGAIFADNTNTRSMAAYEWTSLAGPDFEGKWIEWDRHTLLVVAYGKQSQVSSLWPRECGILRHDKKQGGVYFYLTGAVK